MKRLLAALLIAATPACGLTETVSGHAEVIDGDTLAVGERKVRLFGIDAPEGRQTCSRDGELWACGEESTRRLAELLALSPVACTGDENDQYGRLVAVCHAGRFELNKTMVEHGWATAFRTYSDAYVADETRAKMARRGIWGSTFDLPQAYRTGRLQQTARDERSPATSPAPREQHRVGGCTIKGNRNRRGQWIYHLPGMPYYEATRAEEMFCSEAEAQGAGYRRALVR